MPDPRIELAIFSMRSNRTNHCATMTFSSYSSKALSPQVALRQSSPRVVYPFTRLVLCPTSHALPQSSSSVVSLATRVTAVQP